MVTVIAEISGNSLHPVTAQLVGAAGGNATVLCPGGIGASGSLPGGGSISPCTIGGATRLFMPGGSGPPGAASSGVERVEFPSRSLSVS